MDIKGNGECEVTKKAFWKYVHPKLEFRVHISTPVNFQSRLIKKGAGLVQSVQWLGYGLHDRASIPGRASDFFSSPPRLDLLWGPQSSSL
jgi:hypothetical protein